MPLKKCPRCQLNYILDGGNLCTVCRKEISGEIEEEDIAELCSECGENPVMPGRELCASCYKEMMKRQQTDTDDDSDTTNGPSLDMDENVSDMDEISISDDLDDEPPFEDDDFMEVSLDKVGEDEEMEEDTEETI